MISPWIISTAILSLSTIVSFYYTFKFARTILLVEDAIESSLDVLDQKYSSLNEILETPLFYNSPEIQKVLREITGARDSILIIANDLVSLSNNVIEAENSGEQEIGN
jgi:hypothetical protein